MGSLENFSFDQTRPARKRFARASGRIGTVPGFVPIALLGLALSACMPTGPEARRAAYLECARDQGLTVVNGTIRTTSAAELRSLDLCEALPR